MIPPSAVKAALAEQVARIQRDENRTPGRREKSDLKYQVIETLATRALVNTTLVNAYFYRDKALGHRGTLLIDTGSVGNADKLVSSLIQVTSGPMNAGVIRIPELVHSLSSRLTAEVEIVGDWTEAALEGPPFGEFAPEGDMVLKDDDGGKCTMREVDLHDGEVLSFLQSGYRVDQLRLADDKISFVLCSDFRLKGIRVEDRGLDIAPGEDDDNVQSVHTLQQLNEVVRTVNDLCRLFEWQDPETVTEGATDPG